MREVSRQEVQQLMARGAQVVDVLPAEECQEDHLPGRSTCRCAERPRPGRRSTRAGPRDLSPRAPWRLESLGPSLARRVRPVLGDQCIVGKSLEGSREPGGEPRALARLLQGGLVAVRALA
jgi:rhodanese-related sulfurtransferase